MKGKIKHIAFFLTIVLLLGVILPNCNTFAKERATFSIGGGVSSIEGETEGTTSVTINYSNGNKVTVTCADPILYYGTEKHENEQHTRNYYNVFIMDNIDTTVTVTVTAFPADNYSADLIYQGESLGKTSENFDVNNSSIIDIDAGFTEVNTEKYTVTFNTNGGSDVANQTVSSGEKATKPDNPTKNNYNFVDWYSDSKLTKIFDFNTLITSNTTIYAKWRANTTKLIDIISDANYIYDIIKESFPSIANTLKSDINTAQNVADDESATAEQVESACKALSEAAMNAYNSSRKDPNFDYEISGKDLVASLFSSGLSATDIHKKGTIYKFSNGKDLYGIESGIILDTSGIIPNEDNDPDLEKLMDYPYGGHTSSLEFTLKATGDLLNFDYAFASGEFDQSARYNDVFGLFVSVNGSEYENIALITRNDGVTEPVSITSLKNGLNNDEFVSNPEVGKEYSLYKFVNTAESGLRFNGISNIFTAKKKVNVGDTVKIKFVIADVSDQSVDSFVFIKGNSLSFNDKKDDSNKNDVIVKPGDDTNVSKEAAEEVSKIIKDIVDGKEVKGVSEELAEKIIKGIANGDEITVTVEKTKLDEADIKDDLEKIKEKIGKNSIIAGCYDIDINVLLNKVKIGKISELDNKITIVLDKPTGLPKLSNGYKRVFKITSLHDGQVIEYETKDNGDTLSCEADLFSIFTVSYEDVKASSNPKTGDNIAIWISLMVVSMLGIVGTKKLMGKGKIK